MRSSACWRTLVKLRDMIRNASGETLDLKAYEADMRHLIDTYIEAKEPRKISPFDDTVSARHHRQASASTVLSTFPAV